jgi:ribosomal protein S18 acetylase RimI-like enzyme
MQVQKAPGKIIRIFSENTRDNLQALIAASCRYDGIAFPFNANELPSSSDTLPTTLLYYVDQTLLGFVCMCNLSEIELFGLVHPEQRRQGIGRALFNTAREIAQQQGYKNVRIGCYGSIPSGETFARANGGLLHYAEYNMELDTSKVQPPLSIHTTLTLCQAAATEARKVASLIAQVFGNPEEEVHKWITKDMLKPQRRIFFIQLQEATIGTVRIVEGENGRTDITTFGILQPYRTCGYGKQALLQVIAMLLTENNHHIALDVATENSRALALYYKCGFQEIRKDSYFRITL